MEKSVQSKKHQIHSQVCINATFLYRNNILFQVCSQRCRNPSCPIILRNVPHLNSIMIEYASDKAEKLIHNCNISKCFEELWVLNLHNGWINGHTRRMYGRAYRLLRCTEGRAKFTVYVTSRLSSQLLLFQFVKMYKREYEKGKRKKNAWILYKT